MADKKGSIPAQATPKSRDDRLKAALKANLARRKAQNRKRAQGTGPQNTTPDTAGQDKDA